MAVFFAFIGFDYLNDYYKGYFETEKEEKIKLLFGIIGIIVSLMHLIDVILLYRKGKRNTEEQS